MVVCFDGSSLAGTAAYGCSDRGQPVVVSNIIPKHSKTVKLIVEEGRRGGGASISAAVVRLCK